MRAVCRAWISNDDVEQSSRESVSYSRPDKMTRVIYFFRVDGIRGTSFETLTTVASGFRGRGTKTRRPRKPHGARTWTQIANNNNNNDIVTVTTTVCGHHAIIIMRRAKHRSDALGIRRVENCDEIYVQVCTPLFRNNFFFFSFENTERFRVPSVLVETDSRPGDKTKRQYNNSERHKTVKT